MGPAPGRSTLRSASPKSGWFWPQVISGFDSLRRRHSLIDFLRKRPSGGRGTPRVKGTGRGNASAKFINLWLVAFAPGLGSAAQRSGFEKIVASCSKTRVSLSSICTEWHRRKSDRHRVSDWPDHCHPHGYTQAKHDVIEQAYTSQTSITRRIPPQPAHPL